MKSALLAAASLAIALLSQPAFAQSTSPASMTGSCNAEMTRTVDLMRAATDMKKKQMAMKELDVAKAMLAKNDEKGCKNHTAAAMDALR